MKMLLLVGSLAVGQAVAPLMHPYKVFVEPVQALAQFITKEITTPNNSDSNRLGQLGACNAYYQVRAEVK